MKKSVRSFIQLSMVLGGFLVSQTVLADEVKVNVNGMVCGFCAQGITKKLNNTGAVENVNVDLENKVVTFKTISGKDMGDKEITDLITGAGYAVVNIERKKP